MKSRARQVPTIPAGIFILTLATAAFLGACHSRFDRDQDEQSEAQAQKSTSQISVENGQTLINLDTATQKRLGVTVATLSSTVTRAQATFPAVVLSSQDLVTMRNSYVAGQAQLQRAQVQVEVADKEYARLKTLFEENQNVSEKSLQAAQGAMQSAEVDLRAAKEQLHLQESSMRQEWGDVIANWAAEGSAQFQSVLDRNELLVQLTMPSGTTIAAPKAISFEIPGGGRAQANFVSAFPRVDPRIQGRSFLYIVSARPGLAPGVNLIARVSFGGPLKGVIIPAAAVVWAEGKAWVYAEVSSDHFARRAVSADVPVDNGFFVGEGFSPGDKIVSTGAQVLLSEEMLVHGQGGGESDEN